MVMKDKEKQNKVNEYFANTLIENCKKIVEQADEEIEEMAKIIALEMCPTQKEYSKFNNEATCYFARCRNIKNAVDKLINAGYRKITEGVVVLTEKEYGELYQRMFDEVRQANDLKVEQVRKETIEKILNEVAITIKTQSVNDYNFDDKVIEEPILLEKLKEIATREGVEIKE